MIANHSANHHALSALATRILAVEDPIQDWSSDQVTVSQSSVASQGNHSLGFFLNGWTQVKSANIDSLGDVDGQLSYDIYLPSSMPWGDTQISLNVPSLGLWYNAGGADLQGLAGGTFHTISVTLPANVVQKLQGTYSDLQVVLTVNGPANSLNPILLDNIVFGGANGTSEPPPGPGDVEQFTIVYPAGVARDRMLLSASASLKLNERVKLSTISRSTNIASLGPLGVTFGAAGIGHTNIYAHGPVTLHSQTEVNGFVRTEHSTITLQDASVIVRGAVQPGTAVPSVTFSWPVTFPETVTALPILSTGSMDLEPGAYDQIRANGGEVFLSSGTYYVDDFVTESSSVVHADASSGPVIIYVRNNWAYRGPIVATGRAEGKGVFVGWLGTTEAPLQAPFVGTAVAPNGKLELRRPDDGQHKGSFFGKSIEVFSDSWVIPIAWDWDSLPDTPNDPDNDGLPWPQDACPRDPTKTEKGLCGCGRPETDGDSDGSPKCIDVCDDDPLNVTFGTCGCDGTGVVKEAGTPCSPESCSGRMDVPGECDGAGHCVGTGPHGQCIPELPGAEGDQGDCIEKEHKNSLYWFCTGAVDWAQAEGTCNSEPGRHLARIDRQSEGQWLSHQLPGSYWVGGNDLTTDGEWFWSGPATRDGRQFWTGGSDGDRFGTNIANWAFGHPAEDSCLTLSVDGKWLSTDCTTTTGFICEQPKRFPLPPREPPGCEFYPDCELSDDPVIDDTYTVEGEDATSNTPQGEHSWVPESDVNASNGEAMRAAPDTGANNDTGFEANSPRLDFSVDFAVAGTYQVWVRGRAGGSSIDTSDSVHVGIDGVGSSTADRISGFADAFGWSHDTMDGPVATLEVPSTGSHTVNVWMAEDGFVIDRLVLTTDITFVPTGDGPDGGWGTGSQCVDIGTQGFPEGDTEEERQLAAAAIQAACEATCQSEADLPCEECTGFASVPTSSCLQFTQEERSLCLIDQSDASFDPTAACESSVDCPIDAKCGKFYECAVPESSGQLTSCTTDADCAAGEYCGHAAPFCMVDGARSPCDVKEGEDCVARCFDGLACGKVHEECASNEDIILNDRCSEVEVCSDDTIVVPANLLENPNTDLAPVPFNESEFFPEELPEGPGEYEHPKPDGCGGFNEPPCAYEMGEHPWCNFKGSLQKSDDPVEVSDDSDTLGDKRGQGGNELLSFDFDPNLDLNYDLADYDPLGGGDFDFSAEASAKASATFNLLDVEGTVTIIDALARAGISRCGFTGDAYLKLFGIDYLPAVTCEDNFAGLSEFASDSEYHSQCVGLNDELQERLDRAVKALRDAQELYRQYQDLAAQGKRLINELCQQLLEGRDLPPQFEFDGCDGVTPEEVIGRFVNYYRYEVTQVVQHYEKMLYEQTAGQLPNFQYPVYFGQSQESSSCDGGPSRETQQIVNVNFAIGPVPMNLTIEAFLEYGVNGDLLFNLDTGAIGRALLPAAADPEDDAGQKNDLASATLTLRPGAAAGIIMFVGAGFDAGPVAAKVGISGDVTLADLELPAYGGVALSVESVVDDRPPPADFLGIMPSYTMLFPSALPQQLRLTAGYRFGMEARISDVLAGRIYGKVKIKFAFFSKTWKTKILEFNSPFCPSGQDNSDNILCGKPIVLIEGQDSTTLAEADTPLAMFQVPVPFPDFGEIVGLELPPFNPREFDGVRSLQTEEEEVVDPRYVEFDHSRVEQLFYDGYCAEAPPQCIAKGDECSDATDCCPTLRFVANGTPGTGVPVGDAVDIRPVSVPSVCTGPTASGSTSTCEECAPEGSSCNSGTDCCNSGYSELMCFESASSNGLKACQQCLGNNVPAIPGADGNGDGVEDGACCEGLIVLDLPGADPVCSYCRGTGGTCAEDNDCCYVSLGAVCLSNGTCSGPVVE